MRRLWSDFKERVRWRSRVAMLGCLLIAVGVSYGVWSLVPLLVIMGVGIILMVLIEALAD